MVDKILFSSWIDVETSNVDVSVSKTGWAPLPGGYQSLVASFPDASRSLAVDKSAWDWTMPAWVAELYFKNKIDQCIELTVPYVRACSARFREVLQDAVVRLPDGSRYVQMSTGLMKSGWLLTLSCNSAAQFYQHRLAWLRSNPSLKPPLMWAMGDDSLVRMPKRQYNLTAYLDALAQTGCLVKQAEFKREFAGYEFGQDRVVPLYQDKHQFLMNYVKPDVEQEVLLAYQLLYALAPGTWLSSARKYCKFPVGSHFSRWARGLTPLDLLDALPDWLN